jgi:hypothetical protein
LPMKLEQKDLGEKGCTLRLEAREAPPSETFVFLTVHNVTDEEQTFHGAMTLIAVRGGIRPSAPFTPISSEDPVEDVRGCGDDETTAPRSKSSSWNERLAVAFSVMIQGLRSVRQEYVALKNAYDETRISKSYEDNHGAFYPTSDEPPTDSFKQIISLAIRDGLELATFPTRVGSILASKGIDDLKNLLSGKREKLEGKEIFLPIPTADVDPGQDKVLIVESLIRMSPTRLVAHWQTATDFSLIDIKVGKNSQLLAYIPVDFSTLIGLGESFRMKMDEAGPGKPIIITVRNTSLKVATFRGVVIGYAVE